MRFAGGVCGDRNTDGGMMPRLDIWHRNPKHAAFFWPPSIFRYEDNLCCEVWYYSIWLRIF